MRIGWRWARAVAAAGALLFGPACGVPIEPLPPPPPPPLPTIELLLSNPISFPRGSAALVDATDGEGLVYLSLPPGTVPSGQSIRIRVDRTGSEVDAPLVDGGLDPVAIAAAVGDSLRVTVIRTSGPAVAFKAAVPPRKPPVIVRTEPRKNRRDVPLNASIVVVFSEPVNLGSLDPQRFSLRTGGQPVAGRPSFANGEHTMVAFVPDGPLEAGAEYELLIGAGIRDGDGNALEAGTVVPFSTVPADALGSGPFVMSDVVGGSAWISMASRTWPTGAGALLVAVTVRGRDTEVTSPMLMEGLDPVAVPVSTGDTVTATVIGFPGPLSEFVFLVPEERRPAVIRSVPEAGSDDVPAGQSLRVVFSEPLATSSLGPGALALVQGGAPVSARVRFADAERTVVEIDPDETLRRSEEYELVVGTAVRDTEGQSLAAPVRIRFRTAAMLDGADELAFVRNGQIFLVRSDGSGLIQLTYSEPGIVNGSPSWSPDGQWIAFSRFDGTDTDIYVMDAEGRNLRRRTQGGYNDDPAWSPDGSRIAFTRADDGSVGIFLVPVEGPAAVTQVLNRPGYDARPSWAPDGTRLSFTSDWLAYDFVYDLYTVNVDGSDVRPLLQTSLFSSPPTYYFDSAWSPNGRTIAVAACFSWSYWTCYPNSGIALASRDGTEFRVIASTTSGSWSRPTWSPDGRTIAFSASECPEGCRSAVRYVRADGSARGFIVADGASPAWRPVHGSRGAGRQPLME